MKQAKIAMQLVCAAALAALLPGCNSTGTTAGGSTAAATTGSPSQIVPMLVEAGFKTYSTKTADQLAHVQSLPPDKITKVNRQGTYMWVYPDAANHQVYAGNSHQYKTFRNLRMSKSNLDSDKDLVTAFSGPGGRSVKIYDGFVPMNSLD